MTTQQVINDFLGDDMFGAPVDLQACTKPQLIEIVTQMAGVIAYGQ